MPNTRNQSLKKVKKAVEVEASTLTNMDADPVEEETAYERLLCKVNEKKCKIDEEVTSLKEKMAKTVSTTSAKGKGNSVKLTVDLSPPQKVMVKQRGQSLCNLWMMTIL